MPEDRKTIEISVIIPFFGDYCRFREQCLDSLVRQDFRDFEIVFVLDGPSIHKATLYSDLCQSRLQFAFIENRTNMGALESRLRATGKARGKYIACLDHDDAYEPNFLGEMHRVAGREQADVVECPIYYHNHLPDGSGCLLTRFEDGERRSSADILTSFFDGGCFNSVVNKLVRREAWDLACRDVGSDLPRVFLNYFEDGVIIANVFRHSARYVTTAATHYHYLQREHSNMGATSIYGLWRKVHQMDRAFRYVERKFSPFVPPECLERFHHRETFPALDTFERQLGHITADSLLDRIASRLLQRRLHRMRRNRQRACGPDTNQK